MATEKKEVKVEKPKAQKVKFADKAEYEMAKDGSGLKKGDKVTLHKITAESWHQRGLIK